MSNKIIEVGFKKKVQPVRIGGMDFEIQLGDKKRKEYLVALPTFQKQVDELQEKMEKAFKERDYEKVNEYETEAKEAANSIVDLLLGEGAFMKLYEAADEDIEVVLEAFVEVSEKYKDLKTKEKAKSYIEGKK